MILGRKVYPHNLLFHSSLDTRLWRNEKVGVGVYQNNHTKYMALIIGIIMGAGVVIFALQNVQTVMVTFLGWGFEGSLALIVILALLAGIIISWLMAIPAFIKNMMSESRLRGHNEALRSELDVHKQKLAETEGKLAEAEKQPDQVIITKI